MKRFTIPLSLFVGFHVAKAQIPVNLDALNREYTSLVKQKRTAAHRNPFMINERQLFDSAFLYNVKLAQGDTLTSTANEYDIQCIGRITDIKKYQNNPKTLASAIYDHIQTQQGSIQFTQAKYCTVSCVKDVFVVRFFVSPASFILQDDVVSSTQKRQKVEALMGKLSLISL